MSDEPQTSFYRVKALTEEELKLERAMDRALESRKDTRKVGLAAVILYMTGFPLLIFGGENTRPARIGNALIICALITLFLHAFLSYRTSMLKLKAQVLVDKYKRKNALPFYQELVEMFADKQVHIHLEDNGSITVTDNRQKEK